MQIKKFKGNQMAEILRRIQRELGPESVILDTQEQLLGKKGRSMGKMIEVTAAIDLSPPLNLNPNPKPKPKPTTRPFDLKPLEATPEQQPQKEHIAQISEAFDTALESAVQSDIYKELQTITGRLSELKPVEAKPEPLTPSPKLHETWLEMKVMLKALTDARQEDPLFASNEIFVKLFQNLIACGIDPETAKHLCKGVKTHLSPEELWEAVSVQQSLWEIVEGLVQVTGGIGGEDLSPFSDGPIGNLPTVIALVGPTGVGKTSTIAKLGADFIKKGKRVTVLALNDAGEMDGGRLMRYADHLGIPAFKVASYEGLRSFVSQRKADETVLVDTAGRSHLRQEEVADLKGLSTAVRSIQTHLVLSANTRGSDMNDMIDRFSVIPIDSLLFTKIDETERYGALFSAMGRKRKPVSYLTTGRRVPENIEVATAKRFTALVLKSA